MITTNKDSQITLILSDGKIVSSTTENKKEWTFDYAETTKIISELIKRIEVLEGK